MKTNIIENEFFHSFPIYTTENTNVTINLYDYTALVRSNAVLDMILAFCDVTERSYAVDDIIATAKQVVAPAISFINEADDDDSEEINEEVF